MCNQSPKLFHLAEMKLCPLTHSFPLTPTRLWIVFYLCEFNYPMSLKEVKPCHRGLLWLAYFTFHNVLKMLCRCQNLIPFCRLKWCISCYPFICRGTLELLPPVGCCGECCYDISVPFLGFLYILHTVHRSQILGSHQLSTAMLPLQEGYFQGLAMIGY